MPPWATSSTSIPRGNAGTLRTLSEMSRLAIAGARDPAVIAEAHDVVRTVPERNDDASMGAMLSRVRRLLRYTHDPLDVELVKAPGVSVREAHASPNGKFVGDCDDASVLLAAMLAAVGIRNEFTVVPADGDRPGEWSHVYVTALPGDGRRVALDTIVRSFSMGQEVPASALSGPRANFPGALAGYGGNTMIGNVNRWRYRPGPGLRGVGADASAASNGGLSPTLAAILGVVGQGANVYLASKQPKPTAVKPAPAYNAPAPSPVSPDPAVVGGFGAVLDAFKRPDGSWNPVKIGAAVAVVGVLVYLVKRKR